MTQCILRQIVRWKVALMVRGATSILALKS